MSRSYKKHPFCKVIDQDFKRLANRKVRNTKDVPNYCAYKKNGYSWSIIDQISRETWEEYQIRTKERNLRWSSRLFFDENKWWNDYCKFYVRK
ncbi:MAG TPA: hypothetical protein VMV95_02430 [Bacillota bacterium]|nr:hypothetical protein [Bacillota bacterium]